MKAGNDPRTDQHKGREGGGYPDPPPNSTPKPAPGGVGNKPDQKPSAPAPSAPYPPSKK